MTCSICLEKYTKELRLKVNCPYCPSNACRGCVQRYLLSSFDDPHCMECRRGWNREFLDGYLTKTFRSGPLRKHRAKVLCDHEKALLPAMQVYVEATKNLRGNMREHERLLKHMDEITAKRQGNMVLRDRFLRVYRQAPEAERLDIRISLHKNAEEIAKVNVDRDIIQIELDSVNNRIIRCQNILAGRGDTEVREVREFILRCPGEGCRGYLSTAYKCGTCDKFVCPDCLVVKGDTRDVEHTCDESTKATAQLIKKETKPCPKCGVRIYKIDGCFAKDTPILCWDGHYSKAQDIKVGDVLVGDDGTPRVVEELCSGGDEMFEVTQGKGMTYTVNSKHKLALKFSGEKSIHWSEVENAWKVRWFDRSEHMMKSKKIRVEEASSKQDTYNSLKAFCDTLNFDEVIEMTIDDYMKLHESTKKHLMGFKSTGVHWPSKDIPLNPYIMGLWLGDGINDAMSFAINSEADPEILQNLLTWCEENKAEVVHDEAYRFRIRRREATLGRLAIGHGASSLECKGCKEKKCTLCDLSETPYTDTVEVDLRHPLKEQLEKYDLPRNSKYIPDDYLTNSREVRLQLLAGLIDTDGYVGNDGKRIQISQSNHTLGKQIEFVARSLGFVVHTDIVKKHQIPFPTIAEKRDYPDHYRVSISGEHLSEIPTRVSRKKCVDSNSTKDELRTGITVKSVGQGTYYGWSVSGVNRRFLLGDFTVARNCDQMWCTQEGCNTAFSWNTGRVVTGVIHNPHYYEFLRRQNNGAVPREAGDIPCGGLPMAWPFTRLITSVAIPMQEKNMILAAHRCFGDITNVRIPEFPARRIANSNMEINVKYLMNELDEEGWQKLLEQRETRFERKREIGQILTMFAHVGADIMRQMEGTLPNELPIFWKTVLGKQLFDLRIYTNQSLKELGARMICAFPQIDRDWNYVPCRKEETNDTLAIPANQFAPGSNAFNAFEARRIAYQPPQA